MAYIDFLHYGMAISYYFIDFHIMVWIFLNCIAHIYRLASYLIILLHTHTHTLLMLWHGL